MYAVSWERNKVASLIFIIEIQRLATKSPKINQINIEVHPAIYDLMFEEESSFLEEMEKQYSIGIALLINPKNHQEKYYIRVT